jgi:Ca2+-binding EF-hand superfamily protein
MKAFTILILTCIAALASTAAAADEKQPRTARDVEIVFQALDRNDDQRISKDEAAREKTLRKRFAAVDASGDGYLTKAEFRARPRAETFE